MTNPTAGSSKHKDSEAGPFTNLSLSYCGHFDQMLKAAEPALRAAARHNLELSRFAAQRGHAWASTWADLAACKTPADLATAQIKFWQAASLNYAEAAHRFWHAWATPGAPVDGAEAAQPGRTHDFIEVRQTAEPKRAAA